MPFRHGYSLFSKSKTCALHEEARYGRQAIGDKKLHRSGVPLFYYDTGVS